jgi:hypothetical protein
VDDLPQEQLSRIWKQFEAGTKYPGWDAGYGAPHTLTRLDPITLWTRTPPDGPWIVAPTPGESANDA